jgi:hypothetical protein
VLRPGDPGPRSRRNGHLLARTLVAVPFLNRRDCSPYARTSMSALSVMAAHLSAIAILGHAVCLVRSAARTLRNRPDTLGKLRRKVSGIDTMRRSLLLTRSFTVLRPRQSRSHHAALKGIVGAAWLYSEYDD